MANLVDTLETLRVGTIWVFDSPPLRTGDGVSLETVLGLYMRGLSAAAW